jgi:hypothetical protein
MPRTVTAKTLLPTAYAVAGVTPAQTAADTVNNNSIVLTGNEIVLAVNTDTAATHTVTITSAPDAEGRTGDITADVVPVAVAGLSGFRVYQRFPLTGYLQTDGNLYLTANSALIKFIVIQLS